MRLTVVSLAVIVAVAAPPQGRASEGGGGGDNRLELRLSTGEDEIETLEATPERPAYSTPMNFEFSPHPRYPKYNGWTLQADITYGNEESTEESSFFTADYTDSALNFKLGMRMRIRWRFPESDDDEPASTPAFNRYSSLWVSNEVLEALDEEDESETAGNSISPLTEDQSSQLEAMFVQQQVSNWLGKDVYSKLQAQFGPLAETAGAEDLSGWDSNMLYCGGTCVGNDY